MTPKTAEEIIKSVLGDCTCGKMYKSRDLVAPDCVWHNYHEDLEIEFKDYTKQVAEATRAECIKVYNESGGNDFEVANINLTQFIK